MPKFSETLGRRIKEFRSAIDITQEALAERLRVAPETISRLERGVSLPSVETIHEIAVLLGTDLRTLFDFPLTDEDRKLRPYLDKLAVLLRGRDEPTLQMIDDVVKRILQN